VSNFDVVEVAVELPPAVVAVEVRELAAVLASSKSEAAKVGDQI
jgi:hypothetical protein